VRAAFNALWKSVALVVAGVFTVCALVVQFHLIKPTATSTAHTIRQPGTHKPKPIMKASMTRLQCSMYG
jgi:LPS O-antigen subunit length determinant protein (WzzB/FepE family)